MKNDIKKILIEVSCASSQEEISIGVDKIENLYAPMIKSLKESNDLVYNLQQELLKNSNELLEIKEKISELNKSLYNKKLKIGDSIECISVHIGSEKCLSKGKKYKIIEVDDTNTFGDYLPDEYIRFKIKDDMGKKRGYYKNNSQFAY